MSNFINMCNMCLSTSEDFVYQGDENDMMHCVQYVLPELFIFESQIPRQICSTCRTALHSFYKFKKMCLENSKRLRTSTKNTQELNDVKTEKLVHVILPPEEQETKAHLTKSDIYKNEEESKNVRSFSPESTSYNEMKSDDDKSSEFDDRECPICNKNFSTKHKLEKHMNRHTEFRSFECHRCNETFMRKSELEVHQKNHSNKKYFECIICEKTYVTQSRLNIHMKIHTCVKQHQCSICNKQFAYSFGLKRHMFVHGEKQFKCAVCDKPCSRKDILKQHMKLHNNSNTS